MNIENSEELNLIMYTDGSAIPNPGVVGFGGHGYAFKDYSDTPVEEFSNTYSDKGYITNDNAEMDTKYVKPEYIIDLFQSCAFSESNNYAEISALLMVLDWITSNEYSFKSVLIYTDSAYVVNGVNQWLEKWEESDFKNISSPSRWKSISSKLKILRGKGIKVQVEWIKGHKGHLGNELADSIANIARNQGLRGNYDFHETVVPRKEYFSDKKELHPLLSFNNLIIRTNSQSVTQDKSNDDDYHIHFQYHTSLPDHQIGKASSSSSYSVVLVKGEGNKPIKNIENIVSKNSLYNSLNLIKLDTVKSKNIYRRIANFPETAICNKRMSNSFLFWDGTVISPEITPPGLLMNVIETYEALHEILLENLYSKNPDPDLFCIVVDITDYFYETNLVEQVSKKKNKLDLPPIPKTTLKEDIKVGYSQITIKVDLDDSKFAFPLLLGMDLPDRNVLKRIEDLHPSIDLLVSPVRVNDQVEIATYYIVIKTDDAFGIWSYWPSNRVYRYK